MSIIFGIRGAAEQSIEESLLQELSGATNHYAPDGTSFVVKENVGMGFQPFYTHERSRLDLEPAVDVHGNMLALDGRIDNYAELSEMLDLPLAGVSDSEIILAAFEQWGEDTFRNLTGDWALALWSQRDRTLYLARDHAGPRSLFYRHRKQEILWSSALETLLDSSASSEACEEFVVRYLCCIPIGTLSPYTGVRAVPAGHFVAFRAGSITIRRHWDHIDTEPLVYKTDAEYEEQFYALFQQAIERRTAKGAPILAQLSGGMDSTAIVCMSDVLRTGAGMRQPDLIETISFLDSSEPNWNELPYVSLVEARRGKSGIHVDLSPKDATFRWEFPHTDHPTTWPEDNQATASQPEADHGFRVVLSGLGGDELLGGVPTPLPELGDLLHKHRFVQLMVRTIAWCETDRVALIHRLRDVVAYHRSAYAKDALLPDSDIPPWMSPHSAHVLDLAAEPYLEGTQRKTLSPSAVSFCRAWWSLLDSLPRHRTRDRQRTEYRFPYLDKDLVGFLSRVPREQLVGPGRRRFLMRRALKHIMPVEILERRRKAFTIRRPVLNIRDNRDSIVSLFHRSETAEKGYIDHVLLLRALDEVANSTNIRWLRCLTRAVQLENWLQSLASTRQVFAKSQ